MENIFQGKWIVPDRFGNQYKLTGILKSPNTLILDVQNMSNSMKWELTIKESYKNIPQ
jgi:hypothetical protein